MLWLPFFVCHPPLSPATCLPCSIYPPPLAQSSAALNSSRSFAKKYYFNLHVQCECLSFCVCVCVCVNVWCVHVCVSDCILVVVVFTSCNFCCCCTLLLFSATVNAILLCNGSEVRLFTSLSLYCYLFLSLSLSLSLYLSLSVSLSIACCWAAPHKPIPFKYLLIYALFVFHSTRVRQLPHPLAPLPPPSRHWFTAPL